MKKNAANILREKYFEVLTSALAGDYVSVISFETTPLTNWSKYVVLGSISEGTAQAQCKDFDIYQYRINVRVVYKYQQKAASYKEVEDIVDTIQQSIVDVILDLSPDFQMIDSELESSDNASEDTEKGILVEKNLTFSHLIIQN